MHTLKYILHLIRQFLWIYIYIYIYNFIRGSNISNLNISEFWQKKYKEACKIPFTFWLYSGNTIVGGDYFVSAIKSFDNYLKVNIGEVQHSLMGIWILFHNTYGLCIHFGTKIPTPTTQQRRTHQMPTQNQRKSCQPIHQSVLLLHLSNNVIKLPCKAVNHWRKYIP
jgi:hypothetical protein